MNLLKRTTTMANRLAPVILGCVLIAGCATRPELPRPGSFDGVRYLGFWYEAARLPVFYQADDTLAVAHYSATERGDVIGVWNRAFTKDGRLSSEVRGTAKAAKGPPAGRFKVSFPGIPSVVAAVSGPNYHVVWVDEDYEHAIVGTPSRRFLWILSRNAPTEKAVLDELIQRAREAGFDTSRLIVAPWDAHNAKQAREME